MGGEHGAEQKAAWRESKLAGLSTEALAFVKKNNYLIDVLIHGNVKGGAVGQNNTLIGLFEQLHEAYAKELGGLDKLYIVMCELAEKREANEEQDLEDMFGEPDDRRAVVDRKKEIIDSLSTEARDLIKNNPVIRLRFFEANPDLLLKTIKFLDQQGLISLGDERDRLILELREHVSDLDKLYE